MLDKKIIPWSYWLYDDDRGFHDSSVWQVLPGKPTEDNVALLREFDDVRLRLVWQERKPKHRSIGEGQIVGWSSTYMCTENPWSRVRKDDVPLIILRKVTE